MGLLGTSSQVRFSFKGAKESYKNKKKQKKKKKEEKSGGGNEAKKFYPSMFLPVLLFFSLYCQERHGMDASREKKD